MATPETVIAALETALATNVGVTSLEIDGRKVSWDRKTMIEQLAYWRQQQATAAGVFPLRLFHVRPGAAD